MRKMLLALACLTAVMAMAGEQCDSRHARRAKLSSMLRRAVSEDLQPEQRVIAFVRIDEGGETAIAEHDGTILLQKGRICIVDMPLEKLDELSGNEKIERVEASNNTMLLTDSLAHHLNAWPVYEGEQLPQAYTGKGVMLGIMDLGFDLTHPNFYDVRQERYRIHALWDMLAKDPLQAQMPVGCSYEGREALQTLGCTYDGRDQTHGTYTLGIAAGSGCGTKYKGMAPETDICMVANATSNNASLIDSVDYYRYTNATNALGFNYIFEQEKIYYGKLIPYFDSLPIEVLEDMEDLLMPDRLRGALITYQSHYGTGFMGIDYNHLTNLEKIIWQDATRLRNLVVKYQLCA